MKNLFCLIAIFCVGTTLFAQTNITGTVRVKATNEPLSGVNVIFDRTTGTVTDADGNFQLNINKKPPFQLEISRIGFEIRFVYVNSIEQRIDVVLDESQTELDEVIISASRTPESIMESPVSIERMDLEDIRTNTAIDFYSGLENLKGVDLNTNSLTFKSVNTRGFATFANTRFVQLLDGIDNSSPALNFALGNLLGMSELDVHTIELLPGAASALYGANAFNGILLMQSKNPFDYQGVSVYARTGVTSQEAAGTNAYLDAGFRVAHAFSDKFAAKFSLSFLKGTEWYATDYDDYNVHGLTRSAPDYDGLNVYGDEVSTSLNFEDIALGAGVPAQLAALMGMQTVSRTGYNEVDLLDYEAESVKADISFNYRPNGDDLEIIYNAKFGGGTTIYQGANRYSLDNFTLSQHKLEIKNKSFFVRGYTTGEKAGDSYDSRFAAINLNRKWKSDTQWFQDYAGAYVNTFLTQYQTTGMANPAESHQVARAFAQTGALVPGTIAFNNAFKEVVADPNLNTGAKFVDDTRIYHIDANYNFSHLIDFAGIQFGGSYRKYSLNSSGTIFTDYDGAIDYNELGLYAQLQKKLFDDQLKFTGSIRYDKSKKFDGFYSPRLSLIQSIGKNRNHNVRVSYQTGFRNPTTQDMYIGLDVGRAILVGSAADNLDRYTSRDLAVSQTGQALGYPGTVNLIGRAAYENAFSFSSVMAGSPVQSDLELVKPEKVKAYEFGYRGIIGSITIDLSFYYNDYEDFIGNKTVVVPYYGQANLSDIHPVVKQPVALIALNNGDFKPFQVYTNSSAEISSQGFLLGFSGTLIKDYGFTINYAWSEHDFDKTTDPDYEASFNTPEHNIKASISNQSVIENLGFKINFRWHNKYLWESSFADGYISAKSVIDAQITYSIPAWNSMIKIGGANIGGDEYFSAPGTGHVGSQYYLGLSLQL